MRFDSLQAYQSPELLRYPLQELCLHTKLLAPQNTSIADFLSKAPEAPAFLNVRNAVHLLKVFQNISTFLRADVSAVTIVSWGSTEISHFLLTVFQYIPMSCCIGFMH